MTDALHAAIAPLVQARRVVEALPDPLFDRVTPLAPEASVGRHLRHCLDVYDAFMDGLRAGVVDYAHRERDRASETQRLRALERMDALVERLTRLARLHELDGAAPLEVRSEDERSCRSTVGRELQYLASHATHHLALIAMVLRAHGHEPPEELGVAPSTLRHRREEPARAAR